MHVYSQATSNQLYRLLQTVASLDFANRLVCVCLPTQDRGNFKGGRGVKVLCKY